MSNKLENAVGLLILITMISLITNLVFLTKILSSTKHSLVPCDERIDNKVKVCYIEED